MPDFIQIIPILRIFSVEKAREFYIGYLGCKIDFEHRFEPGMPLYMQVSRPGLMFHLSEHHGDGTPGSCVCIRMQSIDAFHAELSTKNYDYLRPEVQEQPWGREMTLTDPFHNSLRFMEQKPHS